MTRIPFPTPIRDTADTLELIHGDGVIPAARRLMSAAALVIARRLGPDAAVIHAYELADDCFELVPHKDVFKPGRAG